MNGGIDISSGAYQAVIPLVVTVLSLVALRYGESILKKYGLSPSGGPAWSAKERELQVQVDKLQSQVTALQKQNEMLEARVEFLLEQMQKQSVIAPPVNAIEQNSAVAPDYSDMVLVIVGPGVANQAELTAFRKVQARTSLHFTRLLQATSNKIMRYLNRKRAAGNPVRYVHLVAASNGDGVTLTDKVVDGAWMSEHFHGVEVLFLAGCQDDHVVDDIGVVPYIVMLMEQVEAKAARTLAETFWEEVGKKTPPDEAFYRALDRSPAGVAEHAQLFT